MNEFSEKMCKNLVARWPVSVAMVQAVIGDVDRSAHLEGLVEAAEYLMKCRLFDAAAELTVLINTAIVKERQIQDALRYRFEEEKPPAGHHAAPRDDEMDES